MIFKNKAILPLTKITDEKFKAILGEYTIIVTDLSLITIDPIPLINESTGASIEYPAYIKLPCKCNVKYDTDLPTRVYLESSADTLLTIANQTQTISNADGEIGTIKYDPNVDEIKTIRYTFKNANHYNNEIKSSLKGVMLFNTFFDDIPDTIEHSVYSTLSSRYGAAISSEDLIGIDSKLEESSIVASLSVKTISAILNFGGIIEIPNISSIISIKRKIWETNLVKQMNFLDSTHLDVEEGADKFVENMVKRTGLVIMPPDEAMLFSVDTNGLGFFSTLWDKVSAFSADYSIEGNGQVYATVTFDKKNYKVFTEGSWKTIVSNDPNTHGNKDFQWYYIDGEGNWVGTGEFIFKPAFISNVLNLTTFKTTLAELTELTPEDIRSDGGFVIRDSCYTDIVFTFETSTKDDIIMINTLDVIVDECGYTDVPVGVEDTYSVMRKNESGTQLHTVVKRNKGIESIVIDYL